MWHSHPAPHNCGWHLGAIRTPPAHARVDLPQIMPRGIIIWRAKQRTIELGEIAPNLVQRNSAGKASQHDVTSSTTAAPPYSKAVPSSKASSH